MRIALFSVNYNLIPSHLPSVQKWHDVAEHSWDEESLMIMKFNE